jgi:ABC-type uncharacterized transport system permease subunit
MGVQRRVKWAKWALVASILLHPPALYLTVVLPVVGAVILQSVSFLALSLTLWGVVEAADVGRKQEGKEE